MFAADRAVARNAVASFTVSNEDFLLPITIMEPCLMDRRWSTACMTDLGAVFEIGAGRLPCPRRFAKSR